MSNIQSLETILDEAGRLRDRGLPDQARTLLRALLNSSAHNTDAGIIELRQRAQQLLRQIDNGVVVRTPPPTAGALSTDPATSRATSKLDQNPGIVVKTAPVAAEPLPAANAGASLPPRPTPVQTVSERSGDSAVPPAARPSAPIENLLSQVAAQVAKLEQQAEVKVEQNTVESLRDAVSLYRQALSLDGIEPERRKQLQERRNLIEERREELARLQGELTTASAANDLISQLVALYQLQSRNVTEVNGQSVVLQIGTNLSSFIRTLTASSDRVRDELNNLLMNALDLLNSGPLDEVGRMVDEQIQRLSGRGMIPNPTAPQQLALDRITAALSNESTVAERISSLTQEKQRAERLKPALTTAHTHYMKAQEHYRAGRFQDGRQELKLIDLGDYRSKTVNSLTKLVETELEAVLTAQLSTLLAEARTALAGGLLPVFHQKVKEIDELVPSFSTPRTAVLRQEADQLRQQVNTELTELLSKLDRLVHLDDRDGIIAVCQILSARDPGHQRAKQQLEQTLNAFVTDGEAALSRNDLQLAETHVRTVLKVSSALPAALRLLDRILAARIQPALDAAKNATVALTVDGLERIIVELDNQQTLINAIDGQTLRMRFEQERQAAVDFVRNLIDQIHKRAERQRLLKETQRQARQTLDAGLFDQTKELVQKAFELDRQDADTAALQIELKTRWSMQLHTAARQELSKDPPQPSLARGYLKKIKDELLVDDRSTPQLEREIDYCEARLNGTAEMKALAFDKAIQWLTSAVALKPDDTAVRSDLQYCYQQEFNRRYLIGDWPAVVRVGVNVQAEGANLLRLAQARLEQALQHATSALQQRKRAQGDDGRRSELERCGQELQNAKKELPAIAPDLQADATSRLKALEDRLAADRELVDTIHKRLIEARLLLAGPGELRDWHEPYRKWQELSNLLDENSLSKDDILRQVVADDSKTYQTKLRDIVIRERTGFLSEGEEALKRSNYGAALAAFRAVCDLPRELILQPDQDATNGLQSVRKALRERIIKEMNETRTLLSIDGFVSGQRSLTPTQIAEKLDVLQELRNIDAETTVDGHVDLIQKLNQARDLMRTADQQVMLGKQQWAVDREQARRRVTENLAEPGVWTTAVALFSQPGVHYIHRELDRNQTASVFQRFEQDRIRLRGRPAQGVVAALPGVKQLFEQMKSLLTQDDLNAAGVASLRGLSETMTALEQELYATTITLIDQDRVQLDRPMDRIPLTAELIRETEGRIAALRLREQSELNLQDASQFFSKRRTQQMYLNVLRASSGEEQLPPEPSDALLLQLDNWAASETTAQKKLEEAEAEYAQAERNRADHLPKTAREHYQTASEKFGEAIRHLEPLCELALPHDSVTRLSRSAAERLAGARERLKQISTAVETCDETIAAAAALMQEARTALEQKDYGTAGEKAQQAPELDKSLTSEAEGLARAAAEPETGSGCSWLVVVLVILVVVLIGVFTFGPGLWQWISEFLFPVTSSLARSTV